MSDQTLLIPNSWLLWCEEISATAMAVLLQVIMVSLVLYIETFWQSFIEMTITLGLCYPHIFFYFLHTFC